MPLRIANLRSINCLIAATLVLLLCGSRATAGCGEYVHISDAGQPADLDHHNTPPADSPCAHGKCDRAPTTPQAPEPTTSAGGGQDAVLASAFAGPQPLTFGDGYADTEAGPPSHVPSAPFHPPRS